MEQVVLERGVFCEDTATIKYKVIEHNEVTCFQKESFPQNARVVLYIEEDKVIATQKVRDTKEQYFQDYRGKELEITKTP